jgi:IS30 family transposase
VIAHLRAHERARRPKPGKVASNQWLQRFVQVKLDELWSPEQISLHLRQRFPDQPERNACPETIYQALYRPGDGIPRALTRKLRTGRPLRRRQRRPDRRTTRFVAAMRSIHDRPIEALDRQQPGHWEGDLIIGTKNHSAIGTIVERTSRYTLLVHLSGDKSADSVTTGVIKALRRLPQHMRLTLAWDRGMEMAEHARISTALRMPVFFCDPASPWQRGTNENTNGLLRQYLPKGTDLSVHSPADLRRIQKELNNRPRKSLGGRTPAEVFTNLSATIDPLRCDDR